MKYLIDTPIPHPGTLRLYGTTAPTSASRPHSAPSHTNVDNRVGGERRDLDSIFLFGRRLYYLLEREIPGLDPFKIIGRVIGGGGDKHREIPLWDTFAQGRHFYKTVAYHGD